MPGRLFREPDERSGPALLGKEPIIFPDDRKEAARKIKNKMNGD